MVQWSLVWQNVFEILLSPIPMLMLALVCTIQIVKLTHRIFFDTSPDVVHLVQDKNGKLKVKQGYPFEDVPSPYENLPSVDSPSDFKPKLNLNKVTHVKKNTVSKRTNVNLKQSVPKQSGVYDRSSRSSSSSDSDIMRSINYLYDEILDLDDSSSRNDSSSSYDGGSSSYDYTSSSSDSSSWGD